MHDGYYSTPSIHRETLVFTCEDDLWLVSREGGSASRITAGEGEYLGAIFSPDGSQLACSSSEEGSRELYVLPVEGGEARRLTYHHTSANPVGWTPEGEIVYASSGGRPFRSDSWLFRISPEGGQPRPIPWGPASALQLGPQGQVLLGRNTKDPSHWKRYRGGTAGEFWIDNRPSQANRFDEPGQFRRLATPDGNVSSPCWVGDRIFFLSDHQGISNVYSCDLEGQDLRRHTDHHQFYARQLKSDGQSLVYACAGDLYRLDPGQRDPRRLEIHLGSSRSQAKRRFCNVSEVGIQSFDLSPDGSRLALVARGKAFSFANWEGPVVQHGQPEKVRYRLLGWLSDQKHLLAFATDEQPDPYMVMFPLEGGPARTLHHDFGTVIRWACSPVDNSIAMLNHRHEVLLLDAQEQLHRLDSSPFGASTGLSFSSDGRWLAYDLADSSQTTSIKVCRIEDRETFFATRGVLQDYSPSFDPDGKYLYFVGRRDLEASHDDAEFGLSFPRSRRLFAIALRKDVPNPFIPQAKPLESEAVQAKKKAEEELSHQIQPTDIDLDGINQRVIAFPLDMGLYTEVRGARNKVLFLQGDSKYSQHYTLEIYEFKTQKQVRLINKWIQHYSLAADYRTVVYRNDASLRVLPAEEYAGSHSGNNRLSGHLDLKRVRISIHPTREFRQMFREAWRLQRDYFWDTDMGGIEWEEVYQRYLPLVDRATTRYEFGDLLWELFGELGTSHAYVSFGSYRSTPRYSQGFLGADWEWDGQGYLCQSIVEGDPWNHDASSPLRQAGIDVKVGERLLAINGQLLSQTVPPGALLVNHGSQEVELTVQRPEGEPRKVSVKTLASERKARYRAWVNHKRACVHQATEGRVGYIHVPDMGGEGYAEFHRAYLAECDREALMIDVRFNGGGNVSGLLLQKLLRRRLGYTIPRWGSPIPYPYESPRGPLLAITNEHAGSDGDIFSHAFKQLNLGPLIGRRTWGGVIGISPSHQLADGTTTTQPEFSFFFDDVGWRLENRGTEPDIDVDIAPQDYFHHRDTQLDRAVEVALELLAQRPAHSPKPTRPVRMQKIQLPPRD
ncbi:PDZ domain-containing protein [bacterium]|nr:PDZ domain-containing protein [bacterium]